MQQTYSTHSNTNTSNSTNNRSSKWQQFIEDPNTTKELENYALGWLNDVANTNLSGLQLDNKYHYLNKAKTCGYKGSYEQKPDGTKYIKLKYHNFKDGESWEVFNWGEALKEIYQNWKRYNYSYNNANNTTNEQTTKSNRNTSNNQQEKEKAAKKAEAKEKKEQRNKAKARKDGDRAWNSASTNINQSLYLKYKGLLPVSVESFIRYYSHVVVSYLICSIVDIENKVKGYQKIADDGRKKFIYGTEPKGGFIPLGKLDKSTKIVYIAEGVASGISVKQGLKLIEAETPKPKNGKTKALPVVLCALYAGNIQPVVESLRKKYGGRSKLKIIIVADNDAWKADEINEKTGLAKGNAGLIAAHKTAVKYNCLVSTPDFTGLDITNKPTDFNDLHQLTNLEEVARQLQKTKKPDANFAYFKEKQKENQRRQRMFSKHIVKDFNQRYLTDIPNLVDEVIQYKTVILDSPIGTAKTELVNHILNKLPNQTALYISHLISLTGQAAERLNLEYYGDFKGKKSRKDLWAIQKLGCCLNSLPMLIDGGKIRTFQILVIDEIEQLLARLTSSNIENRATILRCLEHLVKSAKLVVVADAHISKTTMHILEQWREGQFLCINNTFMVGKERKIIFHELPGSIQKDAIDELIKGGKVFLLSNNKKLARQTYDLMQPICQLLGIESLYISADNNNDPEVVEAFANPETLKKYGLVVCTPSVNTGLSIEDPSITFVGGMFSSKINSACDAMQALGRVRDTKKIHCWIDERKNTFPTDKQPIIARWTKTFDYDLALMSFDKEDTLTISDPIYEQLVYDVIKSKNISKNNFYAHFLKLAAFDGYTTEHKELSEGEKIECAKLQKTGREEEALEFIQTRANAMDLEDQEAIELEKRSRREFSQTRALDKHNVKKFYRLPDDAPPEEIAKVLEFDDRGRGQAKVLDLEIALYTDEQLREKYLDDQKKALENGSLETLTPHWKHYATTREFFLAVMLAVGITKQLELKQVESKDKPEELEGYLYNKDSESISNFVEWIISRRDILEGIMNIPKDSELKINPLQFLSYQLRKLNLEQGQVAQKKDSDEEKQENIENQENKQESKRERFYRVNESSLKQMKKILLTRGVVAEILGQIANETDPRTPFPITCINNIERCADENAVYSKRCANENEHTDKTELPTPEIQPQPQQAETTITECYNTMQKQETPSINVTLKNAFSSDVQVKIDFLRHMLTIIVPKDSNYLAIKRVIASFFAIESTSLKPSEELLSNLDSIYSNFFVPSKVVTAMPNFYNEHIETRLQTVA